MGNMTDGLELKPLLARRPVFDNFERVFAYDLAVRGPLGGSAFYQEAPPEQLIAQIFLDIGIDRVAPGHDVLVTVNRDLLLGDTLPSLPADRVILQIPTTVGADAEVAAACAALAKGGYRLAVHVEDPSKSGALLSVAHVAKFDVTSVGPVQLLDVAKTLRSYPGRLLATNVRHSSERNACATIGFDLFEGYRFSTPETVTPRELGMDHLNAFRVLNLVREPTAKDQEIEDLLRRDVGLSYKLLRMVNSAATGARDIQSIGHALRILGREQVARWLAILLVTDGNDAGVRAELVHLALVRARMCESMAHVIGGPPARGALFLVGMVSVLDQLLELPMPDLCEAMKLAPELRSALVDRAGLLGSVLRMIDAYVAGDWEELRAVSDKLGADPSGLGQSYIDAIAWASSHGKGAAA